MEKPSTITDKGASLFTGILFLTVGLFILVCDAFAHHVIDVVQGLALTILLLGGMFMGTAILPNRTPPSTTKE